MSGYRSPTLLILHNARARAFRYLFTCNEVDDEDDGSPGEDKEEGEDEPPEWMTPAVVSRLRRLGRSRRFRGCLRRIRQPKGDETTEEWRELWFAHEPDTRDVEYLKHLKAFDQVG